jgi:hypothetical protein
MRGPERDASNHQLSSKFRSAVLVEIFHGGRKIRVGIAGKATLACSTFITMASAEPSAPLSFVHRPDDAVAPSASLDFADAV